MEYFGFLFFIFWMAGCNMAGMGGGGTMVAISILIFGFNVTDAITLSNLTICMSGITRYLFDFNKRHPLKKDLDGKPSGTLLEYNIGILLMPMSIVGAALGAILSYTIPEPV